MSATQYVIAVDFHGERWFVLNLSAYLTPEYPDAMIFTSRRAAMTAGDLARQTWTGEHHIYVYSNYGCESETYVEIC